MLFRVLVLLTIFFALCSVGAIIRLSDWLSGAVWAAIGLMAFITAYVVRKSDQEFENWKEDQDHQDQ